MASIDQSGLVGKVRDQPINSKLERVLLAAAADADVDVIRVISGGQPGSGGGRKGSHRHDGGNAADLDLVKDGRTLNFTNSSDREIFREFVRSAAAHGAIGIGAGVGYMGPTTIHVGFGNGPGDTRQVVWGPGNASANAPAWLREAARSGWANPSDTGFPDDDDNDWMEDLPKGWNMADDDGVERFRPLLDFIATNEVGTTGEKGYNTSLNFGRHLPNGKEQNLVSKTLDQIDALQTYMLKSSKSSAIGRYQIVRTTLRGLRSELGLSGSELYSQALQDRLGATLIKRRGLSISGLGNEWTSLKNVSPKTLTAKYNEHGDEKPGPDNGDNGDKKDFDDKLPTSVTQLLQMLLAQLLGQGTVKPSVDSDWSVLKVGVNNEEAVKRLQAMLNDLRYYTGGTDGKFGSITRGAVALFQLDHGLPATGEADADTWAALTNGSARPLSEQRLAATADDLRKLGSQTVRNADFARYSGWLAGLLGVGGLAKGGTCTLEPSMCLASPSATSGFDAASLRQGLTEVLANVGQSLDPSIRQSLENFLQSLQKVGPATQQVVEQTTGFGDPLSFLTTSLVGLLPGGWAGSLLALGLGYAVNRFGNNIIDRRVADQRAGKHIGPATQ